LLNFNLFDLSVLQGVGVYLQDFLQYYDEFMFLNHIEFKSYCTNEGENK